MSRYYFHVKDGHVSLDDEGMELPTLGAARDFAIQHSGKILRDGASSALWSGTPWSMWVTDAPNGGGTTFFTLRFSGSAGEGVPL